MLIICFDWIMYIAAYGIYDRKLMSLLEIYVKGDECKKTSPVDESSDFGDTNTIPG